MNTRMITAMLAAVTAAGSLGAATAADAQSRGRGPDHNTPSHAQPAPPRAHPAPASPTAAWAHRQQAQRHYRANRYQPPRGYQARQWTYGQRMPAQYRSSSYVVNDYQRYGLRAPPRGYQYVRSGNDVVLTAIATGLVAAVIASLFSN